MSLMFIFPPGGEIIEGTDIEEGDIRFINSSGNLYEISVGFRGYRYHVIFGKQINGRFICIPSLHIGADLATYKDMVWNTDSLIKSGLPEDLARMFAQSLYEASYYLT